MGRRTILQGKVVSDKMDKTITVWVEGLKPHPLYQKVVKKVTVIKAHNPDNKARAGDIVEVIESRPISKTKRWSLYRIVKRGKEKGGETENDTEKLNS